MICQSLYTNFEHELPDLLEEDRDHLLIKQRRTHTYTQNDDIPWHTAGPDVKKKQKLQQAVVWFCTFCTDNCITEPVISTLYLVHMLGLKTAAIVMDLMKSITTTLRGVSLDVYMYIIEKLDQHMHWKKQSHIQMTQKQQQMHNLSLNLAGAVCCVVCCDMYAE